MIYSCALFEGTDDLDSAQIAKLKWFHDGTRITPDKRVLDIGCGWGGNLEFLVRDMGVRDVTGITLSRAQLEEIQARATPGVAAELVSYKDYAPARRFDAVISIGMFEHIATPEQARSGEHIALYRDYFRRAWTWTNPGSWFGLQSVIGCLIPRDRNDLRQIARLAPRIFPGAVTPRLEAIVASATPYWEVMEVATRREHYRRTTGAWLSRLRGHEATIRERYGDERFEEYVQYLSTCIMAFEKGYHSLVQMRLRRIDGNGSQKAKGGVP